MQFGRYRLLARIGSGGMAEVYRALALGPGGFEKEVVVKRILPDLSVDPSFADMFLEEARIASRLDHPSIVQIHDLGCVDETYFIVMEYVRGMDLSALVAALAPTRKGKPPLETAVALRVVADVCRALDYAHRLTGPDGKMLGLVHRDVSPQNVLVSDEGAVKLADFGIARAMEGGMRRTLRGLVRGKARYMSPEQARGQSLDLRSDVYAAGIILYELLTGRHPYAVADFNETLVRAANPAIEAPSRHAALDGEIDALVMHALAPDVAARFSSAAALLEAIETYLHDARLRVGPTDIARAMRAARDAAPTRVVSLDAAIAGELGAGGGGDTQDLGELEVTGGSGPSGLPVFRKTDGTTMDYPAVVSGAPALGVAPSIDGIGAMPTVTIPLPRVEPSTVAPVVPPARTSRALPVASVLIALAVGSALTMIVLASVGGTDSPDGVAGNDPIERDAGGALSTGSLAIDAAPAAVVPVPPIADTSAADAGVETSDASAETTPTSPPTPPAREPARVAVGDREPRDTRPARLDIGARPNWATIHVDGRLVGTTPCSTSLAPGAHTVVATNASLGLRQRRRITVRPGERERMVFDPF